jgi:hypothetical protein
MQNSLGAISVVKVSSTFRAATSFSGSQQCALGEHLIVIKYYSLGQELAHLLFGRALGPFARKRQTQSARQSAGIAMDSTALLVGKESTFDLSTMGNGTVFFAMGAGGYARIFLIKDFKSSTEPVLRACGDHW